MISQQLNSGNGPVNGPIVEYRRMRVHQPQTPVKSGLQGFIEQYAIPLSGFALVLGVALGWFSKRR